MWGEIFWKMLFCLILSAIIGAIIGWLLRSLFGGNDEVVETASNDGEIKGLKSRISSLEGDLDECRAKRKSMEADLQGWETKAANFADMSSGSNDENAKLQAEIDSLKVKLEETEGEKAFLLDRVKRTEAGEVHKVVPMEERDDLELVYGVGPVIERMLYDLGVYFFKDIASWDDAKIDEISAKLPQFKDRIRREGWIESAKEEHFKKYGERL